MKEVELEEMNITTRNHVKILLAIKPAVAVTVTLVSEGPSEFAGGGGL